MEKLNETDFYILSEIERDVDFFVDSNIFDLEEKYFTSKSTLLRLVKKLGFDKLKAMQIFYAKKSKIDQLTNINENWLDEQKVDDVVNNISALSMSSILETNNVLVMEDLQKAAELLINNKNIIMFGLGNSGIALNYFSFILKRIGIKSSFHNSVGGLLTELAFSDLKNTTIIIASNSLKSKEIIFTLKHIGEYKTIIIKNRQANIKFDNQENWKIINYVANSKEKYRFPVVSSICSQMYVINVLFNIVLKNIDSYIDKIELSNAMVNVWNNLK